MDNLKHLDGTTFEADVLNSAEPGVVDRPGVASPVRAAIETGAAVASARHEFQTHRRRGEAPRRFCVPSLAVAAGVPRPQLCLLTSGRGGWKGFSQGPTVCRKESS